MKKEEFDSLPYTSRKELVDLRQYCSQFEEENSDIIYREEVDTVLHQFRDTSQKFCFNIRDVKLNAGETVNHYKVYYNPGSLRTIQGTTSNQKFEEIKQLLKNWIVTVRKMHEVTEEYYNPYGKFYDEEFVDFFVNNDADAATSPFDIERQELLFYFLTYAEVRVNQSEELDNERKLELIGDIQNLKDNIPNFTKKKVVSAFSKIAQKTKKFSNKLFHAVFDVMKKELIKQGLYEVAGQIPGAIKQVQHWLHLLQ